MKTIFLSVAIATYFGVLPHNAFADAGCPKADNSTWLSKLDMQKKIVNTYGFAIKLFKIDGNCYEIYGWEHDKNGQAQKIEVYFNPVDGEIVKKKLK